MTRFSLKYWNCVIDRFLVSHQPVIIRYLDLLQAIIGRRSYYKSYHNGCYFWKTTCSLTEFDPIYSFLYDNICSSNLRNSLRFGSNGELLNIPKVLLMRKISITNLQCSLFSLGMTKSPAVIWPYAMRRILSAFFSGKTKSLTKLTRANIFIKAGGLYVWEICNLTRWS